MTTTRALIEAEIERLNDTKGSDDIVRAAVASRVIGLRWVLTLLPLQHSPDRERVAQLIADHLIFAGRVGSEVHATVVETDRALADQILALIAADPIPAEREGFVPTHRHVKRGTEYQVLDDADLQTEKPLSDYAVLTVYRGQDGRLWARPSAEFNDGRFELISAAPVLSGRGETGWRPLDKEADFDTNGWLWAPPENIFSEPEGPDGVIYFGKPRNWTWATMIWPVVQPAPPAKPSGVGKGEDHGS